MSAKSMSSDPAGGPHPDQAAERQETDPGTDWRPGWVGPGGWFPWGTFNCPVREVLDRIGDKWSLLVMTRLGAGTRRFGDLQREVDGISQRMLTRTLRSLERDGLVVRVDYHEVPPRVEYHLTPLGETLRDPVQALGDWATQHRSQIRENRLRYDQEQVG